MVVMVFGKTTSVMVASHLNGSLSMPPPICVTVKCVSTPSKTVAGIVTFPVTPLTLYTASLGLAVLASITR